MRLYFIRHGQSTNNAKWNNDDYQEVPDPELTEIGHIQAAELSQYLVNNQYRKDDITWNNNNEHGFGFTHIYTSLMVRAVSTAIPIADALGLSLVSWIDIHETGGIFSRIDGENRTGLPGKKQSYFESHFPGLVIPEPFGEKGWWNKPFEELNLRTPRAERVWAEIMSRHGDKPGISEHHVALISHGGFFNYLLTAALGIKMQRLENDRHKFWFIMNNCGITRIDVKDDQVFIAYTNRISHLRDNLIT
jgi:2,3-bisphosphoglycerate-dependent phosphoglycerate mutase